MNIENAKKLCVEKLLVPFEGTGPMTPDGKFMAYKDPGNPSGLPITIAWGLTYDEKGNKINLGDVWDYKKAMMVKTIVLEEFTQGVIRLCPNLLQESENKFAAVLSFAYNVGLRNLQASTLRRKILAKDWIGASQEFVRWNRAGGKVMRGLTRRREAEAKLFLE